jgi:hypothetical protein
MRCGHWDRAVSEAIGAVLLISIVMTAVSIVGVVLWSQPAPQKIPALDAIISKDTGNQRIRLYHDGGDLISAGDIKILVDGNDYTAGFKKAGVSGWSSWATGESLDYTYSGTTSPARVQIIYTHEGASSVIASSQFAEFASSGSTGGSANTTPSRTITATAGTGGTITPLGQVIVPVGSSQSFTITPNSGYNIAGVTVDGVPNGTITGYTFTNVVSDHTITATFTGYSSGIRAAYYSEQSWSTLAYTNYPTMIRFADLEANDHSKYTTGPWYTSDVTNWPVGYIGKNDTFSVRFTGYLNIVTTADYRFNLTSDDGSWLWVDGVQVIDNSGVHAPLDKGSAAIHLTPGFHPIRVDMYENTGRAVVHLEYSSTSPTMARTFVTNFWHD